MYVNEFRGDTRSQPDYDALMSRPCLTCPGCGWILESPPALRSCVWAEATLARENKNVLAAHGAQRSAAACAKYWDPSGRSGQLGGDDAVLDDNATAWGSSVAHEWGADRAMDRGVWLACIGGFTGLDSFLQNNEIHVQGARSETDQSLSASR
jgi:hypothetical protein